MMQDNGRSSGGSLVSGCEILRTWSGSLLDRLLSDYLKNCGVGNRSRL